MPGAAEAVDCTPGAEAGTCVVTPFDAANEDKVLMAERVVALPDPWIVVVSESAEVYP